MNLGNETILVDYSPEIYPWISPIQDSQPRQSGLLLALSLQQIGIPPTPLLYYVAGGSLAATTYYIKTTYISNGIESAPSAEASLAVGASNVLGVVSPPTFPEVTGWNVYVSTASGNEVLQNNTGPIAIGSNWQEPTTGLIAWDNLPPASKGIVVEIDGVDLDFRGLNYPLLLSAPILTTGRYTFGVGPLLWSGVTQGVTMPLPNKWQAKVTPVSSTNGTPYLYRVSYTPF